MSASAATAATTGGQLADVAQVDVEPGDLPGPVRSGPSPVQLDVGAHLGRACRAAGSPAWVVCCGQPGTRHPPRRSPARRPGTAPRWTGPARSLPVDARDRARARPASGRRSGPRRRRRPRRRLAQHLAPSCPRAAGSGGLARVRAASTPSSNRAAAEQQGADELAERRRRPSSPGRRARAGAAHGEGQAVAPSSSMVTPRSRRAPRIEAIGRIRARGSPSKRMSPLARPATGGRNRMTVPASPQSTWAGPRSGPGVDPPAGHPWTNPGTQRPQSGDHQLGVTGLQGAGDGARPVGEGREHERPVGLRLAAGDRTVARTGPLANGAGHGSSSAGTRGSLPDCGRLHGVCGRYAAARDTATLVEEFEVETVIDAAPAPNYNVAPTERRWPSSSSGRSRRQGNPNGSCAWPDGGWCPRGRRTPRSAPG